MSKLNDLLDTHGPAAVSENPRAVIGNNRAPTPFEIIEAEILLLFQQASDYLDGDALANQAQADDVGNLLDMLRKAEKKAEAERVKEKTPFDEKIDEIQQRYNSLIGNTKSVKGKTILAKDACTKTLAPWLQKLQDEIDAKAAAARIEADRLAQVAREALRASDITNLAQRAAAEELVADAKIAERVAVKAEKVTAHAGGSDGRAIGLRTTYTCNVDDPLAFGKWLWIYRRTEYLAFFNEIAKRVVDSGLRDLPGVTATPDRRAV